MNEKRVLLVESDPTLRQQLAEWLCDWGYDAFSAASLEESHLLAAARSGQAVIIDLDGPSPGLLAWRVTFGKSGELPLPVIFLTSNGRADGELPALLFTHRKVSKPVNPSRLRAVLGEVMECTDADSGVDDEAAVRLVAEVSLWQSAKMRAVWEIVQQAASVDVTVLIAGETGTGKELVARGLHHLSSRRGRAFVKVNCAAVPRELLESELFGHERGAFTGAHQTRIGMFEAANGGTVFLDEIGDLDPALQAKLLHVLQDGAFSRVGGSSTIKGDVRVLAATNKDLERAVADGRFRDDLFYRLNVIQITVPPLRERVEEIPLLTDYFIRRYAKLYNRADFKASPVAMERLLRHHYPGNVRELENIAKRMIVMGDPSLSRTPLSPGPPATPRPEPSVASDVVRNQGASEVSLKVIAKEAAQAAERAAIARVLEETGWNRTKAAKLLRISYRALLYKIKYAGLDRTPSTSRPLA